MRSAWFRRLGLAAIAGWVSIAGLGVGSVGCQSERPLINRVQADAIRKSDLVGDFHNGKAAPEWYMRNLILQVQRTNPWFSDGLQDMTRRIRFEITENYLYARDAYDYIANSDGHGGPAGTTNNGAVVAVWPITSHFDIRNDYNPVTGETLNVLVENATDRRWYDRDFMRVDWSTNVINDPNSIYFFEKFSGELQMEPVPFYENDPHKPLASHLEELPSGYLEITAKWLAHPATFDYYGYEVPYCLLINQRQYPSAYSSGTDPCTDQEVTIRSSFVKVPMGDQATDYEVAEVTPADTDVVGTINLQRSGYDREYGVVDQTWHTYIQRYNLWQKSHTADVCGQDNNKANGDAACGAAVNGNSTCDMNVKLCTIPMEQRTVRPVTWFVDPELPPSLYGTTADAVGQWNTAFMNGIAYAREAECRRAGTDRATCHGKWFTTATIDPKVPDVANASNGPAVVVCHNPVVAGDDQSCGPVGTAVRKGDIRHHMIAWWNNPSWERPLGVVVPGGDPLTGEEVGSIVNFFGASLETYTARFRDYIQLINGDVLPSEYAAGWASTVYSEDPINTMANDPTRDPALDALTTSLKRGPSDLGLSPQEVQARVAAVDLPGIRARLGMPKLSASMSDAQRSAANTKFLAQQGSLGVPGFGGAAEHDAKLAAKVQAIQSANLEANVANTQWMQTAGADPGWTGTKAGLDAYSPLRGGGIDAANDFAHEDHPKLSNGGYCALKIDEMGLRFEWLAGVGAKYKARYPDGAVASGPMAIAAGVSGQQIDRVVRGKLIYQELLQPMYEFTILHEMGHLVSLEHDFSGSWDSPNYYPEYWTLRAHADKSKMAPCAAPRAPTDPDNCVGPRWIDPITPDELGAPINGQNPTEAHDSINDYAVASVMDYKFDSVYAARLAPYDTMAAKYIYGRVVETFDDYSNSIVSAAQRSQFLWTLPMQNSERWLVGGNYQHYTDVARNLNLFDPGRCRPQTAAEKERGFGAMGLVCQIPHRDHVLVRDMADTVVYNDGAGFELVAFKGREAAGAKRVRWPYKVGDGTDFYVHEYYYDDGADFYEITRDELERYDLYYLDYFFRKNKREANVLGAGRGMEARFFGRIQELQWNALSDAVRNGSTFDPSAAGQDAETTARALAVTMLFDGMTNAMLRPQPGAYAAAPSAGQMNTLYGVPAALPASCHTNSDCPTAFTCDTSKNVCKGLFDVGVGDARYVDNQYDLTKGYDYQAYIQRSGTFLEKPYAAIALTDSRPQLSTIARQTYLDGRNVMFNFRDAVPRAFDRLIAGAMANDWDSVAPYIDPSAAVDPVTGYTPISQLHLWDDRNADGSVKPIARPAGAKVIDPMFGFRAQLPAMYLMLLFEPINSNMELINRTRIWIEGGPEAISIPDSEKLAFYDPVEGTQWSGRSFGAEQLNGKWVDIGIGARMIEHANELLVAAYGVDTENYPGSATQLRAKYGPDWRPTVTDTSGTHVVTAADVKDPVAAQALRDFVGFMNDTRQLLYILGFGPCGRGETC